MFMRNHFCPGCVEVLKAGGGGGERQPPPLPRAPPRPSAAPPYRRAGCASAQARPWGRCQARAARAAPPSPRGGSGSGSGSDMGDTLEEPWWETPSGAGSSTGTRLLELASHAGLETVFLRASPLFPGPHSSFSFISFSSSL